MSEIEKLKEDYKDDIIAVSEERRKYRMITNSDGTVSFVDATEYQQHGTNYGAGDVNKTNIAINLINKYLSDLLKKQIVEHFLTKNNYTEYLAIGNLRGGRIENISGNKVGNVVTLYVQINDITSGGEDIEIFRFKESYKRKYGPMNYAVNAFYINKEANYGYIGQFSDGHFTMAIAGSGTINTSNRAQVIFTITYITEE